MITNNTFAINSNNYSYDLSVRASAGIARDDVKTSESYDVNTNEFGDTFEKSYIVDNADGRVAAKMPQDRELPQIDSLAGLTLSQVETYYLEGRVSRYDYDVKVEQVKEALKESERTDDTTSDDSKAEAVDNSADVNKQVEQQKSDSADSVERSNSDKSNSKQKASSDMLNETMDGILSATQSEAMMNAYFSEESPAINFEILQNIASGATGGNTKTWDLQLGA